METNLLKKKINEVTKAVPSVPISEDTIPMVADYLARLEDIQEKIKEIAENEKAEYLDKINSIESKEKELLSIIEGEIQKWRGMVNNYFTAQVRNGQIVEKSYHGEKGKITLIADVTVAVQDKVKVMKAVIEGKYGEAGEEFVKINEGAIKKFVKATKMPIDGILVENAVYMRFMRRK